MSQENVEVMRAANQAFNRGDWDALPSYVTPDFKFDTTRDLNEERGLYETPETAKGALKRFYEAWASWHVEITEFIEVDEPS